MRVCTVALFMVGAVAVGTTRQAAAQNEFHWKGPVAAGKAIEIKGVNGDVRAIARSGDGEGTAGGDAVDFSTVNGGITLTLPANLSTEVRASTVNGDIETDFPLMVTGRFGPRRLNGTIGSGERRLALQTVNGSIRLRKIA